MFLEKKNANTYNYSKEFPPTLRDLVARVRTTHHTVSRLRTAHGTSSPQLGDFKWDYKQLVLRLGPLLKKEHEDRLTYIEWELDDIVEEVLKPEEPEEQEEQEEEELEFDLERVKAERDAGTEAATACSHCSRRLEAGGGQQIYGCVRRHLLCPLCRTLRPGCVCPVCLASHGDRRRLALLGEDLTRKRKSPKSALISHGLAKRRVALEDVTPMRGKEEAISPQILNVWSCTEESAHTLLQPPLGEITLEGPVIKAEPEPEGEESHQEEPGPQLHMSALLPHSMMSNQLLELIDSTLLGPPAEEQQPTNYNDPPPPEALGEQEVAQLQEPVTVSTTERRLMARREQLSSLLLLPASESAEADIARVSQEIVRLRQEVAAEEPPQHEVLDPWLALQRLQVPARTPSIDSDPAATSSWNHFRARAASADSLPSPPAVQPPAPGGPPRGCRLEAADPGALDLAYSGPLAFTLMKDYSGSGLEWRTFLQIDSLYKFDVGRAGHVFYLRAWAAGPEGAGHTWRLELAAAGQARGGARPASDAVHLGGVFSLAGTPFVLPLGVRPGDVRDYHVTISRA
jgi:hypothetical protein